MQEMADEILMVNVVNGELDGLSVLFERYHVRMFNFFLKITLDEDESHDLTQALFYRVMKYRQSYRQEAGSFKTWMYRMARNLHADFCAAEARKNSRLIPLDEVHENLPSRPDSYSEEDYSRLDSALHVLGQEQRELLVLSRFQGMKYGEIADIMGVSVANVKVKVHRTIQTLRAIYFNDNI